MTNAKSITVLLSLLLSSTLSFAQHEELMEQAHGLPRDHMLQAFLESNGVDANSSLESLHEAIAFYNEHEAELLYEYDVERHKMIVAGVSQTRAARQAQWGQALTGMLSGVAQAVDASQQQAKAEREAKQAKAERDRQQRIQERTAANQQALAAAQQYSQAAADPNNFRSTSSSGSIRDLYTSDPAWNRSLDMMVQQHGVEKTRQMVQEMKARNTQSNQSSYSTQQTGSSGPVNGTILMAITTSRTQIYVNVVAGEITHYATGKDMLGKYNWQYVGRASITGINMTPYEAQFGKEYSRAANINGIGYVFFN